jgi:hypothetical protein
MATSIEQSAVNALKTYLQTQLGASVKVSGTWPNPDKNLPEKALTILKIGPRLETKIDPRLLGSAELTPPDPTQMAYTWQIKAVEQRIQLDVWAKYEGVRDDLQAQLDNALNQGTYVTLGPGLDRSHFSDGLILELGDGHVGYATYTFDGPEIADEPEAAQRNEFRSTQVGTIYTYLAVTKVMPRIARIQFPVNADGVTDTFTVP